MKAILIGALCLLFGFQWATAQSGLLDPSFDGDGMAFIPNIQGNNLGTCAAVSPNGDIVLAGTIAILPNGNPLHVGLARLHQDGSLDTTFNGGIFFHPFGDGSSRAVAIALQTDGKIVVAFDVIKTGEFGNFGVARFHTDGSLDSTFGNQGLVSIDILGNHIDNPKDMIILPNGKIVVGGTTNQFNNVFYGTLICLQSNGSLDPNFGANGKAIISTSDGPSLITNLMALPNGDMMAAGETKIGNDWVYSLSRMHSNGLFDSTFNTDGVINFAANLAHTNHTYCLGVQADGKVLMGGYSIGNGTYPMVIARLEQNGTFDASFGTNGKAVFNTLTTVPQGFSFGAGGKIYVGGKGTGANGIVLHRLQANGSLDSTFGTNGTVDYDMGGVEAIEYCVVQPDGKILIGGSVSGDFALARFFGETTTTDLHAANDNPKLRVFPNPVRAQATVEFTLAASEIVSLSLLDVTGREMCVWVVGQPFPEGVHYLQIKIPDAIPAGLYWLRCKAGASLQTCKLLRI